MEIEEKTLKEAIILTIGVRADVESTIMNQKLLQRIRVM